MRPYDFKDNDPRGTEIRTTHKSLKNYWILTDGYRVSLHQQKNGHPSIQDITIPRAEFNQLIAWYMRNQKPPRRRNR